MACGRKWLTGGNTATDHAEAITSGTPAQDRRERLRISPGNNRSTAASARAPALPVSGVRIT